ncbi:uncharacterized protein LOC129723498 [Wyeomyia smithii]|uniref:uncharacterized protein LOC129723498 n=1 Tax=Wyeomyia smithii TaxID=174621 RepID=UPI002467C161|nr:uncharacterized protein LOC129723498 [Wyeomyia smithii]
MMRLSIAIVFTSLAIACTYAIEVHSTKHRTARYVRQYPSYFGPRFQSIEYPSYNIPNPYGPGTYAFGYEIDDPTTGNVQFRDEEKLQNGTVRGSYGYLQPDGSVVITKFNADEFGYRANTEIKRADGQLIATIPGHFTPVESQGNSIDRPIGAAANPYPQFSSPPTYNPVLSPNYVDPQYTSAILSHIKNQQFYPSQGLVHYPYGSPSYDVPSNGNFFSNYFGQIPTIPNPLTTFPAILPQDNAFNSFASNFQNGFQQFTQNNPFGNFINTAQSQFGQYIPQGNPFASWFNPNSIQSSQYGSAFNRPGAYADTGIPPNGVFGDMPVQLGMMGNRIPTTKRRGITTTRRKNGYKTRDGTEDWLDEFLESRKREVFYGLTTTTTTTPPTPSATATTKNGVGTAAVVGSNRMR